MDLNFLYIIKILFIHGDTNTLEPFLPYLNNCNEFYVDVSKNSDCHLIFEKNIDKLIEIKNKGTDIILMHIDDYYYIKTMNNDLFYIN